jgi:hypothetical protein
MEVSNADDDSLLRLWEVFDVVLRSKESNGYPCPTCGKVEIFDLGEWERKAIAWNQNMIRRGRGG